MNEERPIIVVKKKGGHAGHHGGAWKVAYADFVTAMMAFFLVMWILGLSQQTRQNIASYFNDPSGTLKTHAGGKSMINLERGQSGKPTVMPSLRALLNSNNENLRFKAAKQQLERMIRNMPEFKAFKDHIEITITKDGLRIELLEDSASRFFETGSSQIKPATTGLLQLIGHELKKMPNNMIVEGHTDARPYAGGLQGYSNFELSSDRANSARRALSPVVGAQISEVRGYADRHLRKPDDPFHYSNRRISILVEYSANSGEAPNITVPNQNEKAPE